MKSPPPRTFIYNNQLLSAFIEKQIALVFFCRQANQITLQVNMLVNIMMHIMDMMDMVDMVDMVDMEDMVGM